MANSNIDPGQAARLTEIKRRAALHNRTLHALCDLAGTDYTQFSRWENGDSSPIARTFNRKCALLEAELDKLDVAVLEDVERRLPADDEEAA